MADRGHQHDAGPLKEGSRSLAQLAGVGLEAILRRKVEHRTISRPLKAESRDVVRAWQHVSEPLNKLAREVRVKEQPHPPATSLRSRSAAKAMQALMSSAVSSGKSLKISAS